MVQGEVLETLVGREAFGSHAGCAIEEFDLDAGVVGHRVQSGDRLKIGSLRCGIFFERIVRLQILFGSVVANSDLCQVQYTKIWNPFENFPDLTYFVRAPGGQYEIHQEIPSAAF